MPNPAITRPSPNASSGLIECLQMCFPSNPIVPRKELGGDVGMMSKTERWSMPGHSRGNSLALGKATADMAKRFFGLTEFHRGRGWSGSGWRLRSL